MPKGHSSSHSSLDALANEPRTEWHSIYFITFICVMDAMRISAVLTNSWPYVAGLDAEINEEFYGLSKSAFTFGAIVASLLSGWLSNRISHTKPPILAGLLMSAMACLFFANLELIPRNRRYGFLIAEILFGVATGAISMWRVHIAMSSTDADRSKATSMVGFAVNLGFVLGPLLVLSFGYFISNRILPLPWGSHFNLFTAPIYLMGLLSLSGAILLFFCFDGRMRRMGGPKGEEADSEKWAKGRQEQLERTPLELAVPSEDQMPPCKRPSKEPGTRFDCAAIMACFVARFCFTAFILYLMALGAPYTMSVFGWTGQQMVLFQMLSQCTMGLMGILICLGYTLRLLSRFKERFCVLGALSMMLGFFLASYPWPFLGAKLPDPIYVNETSVNGTVVQKLVSHGCDRHKFDWCEDTPAINIVFYHVALIICLGLAMPVGQLNLDVLYSRLLGPIKQGTMQGLFVAVGDIVTLCGPVIITAFYQKSGPRLIWLGEIALFLLGIAFWAFCYGRLVPSGYQAVPQADSAPVSEETKWDVTNVDRREAQPKIFQTD